MSKAPQELGNKHSSAVSTIKHNNHLLHHVNCNISITNQMLPFSSTQCSSYNSKLSRHTTNERVG